MKPIRSVHSLALTAAILLASPTFALAQSPGNVNVAITKLFGNTTAFSAVTDLQVIDKSQKEWARAQMDFTILDDKIRVDIDMGQLKSASLPAKDLATLKQLGMARLASVVRPDKKIIYLVYPDARSYVNLAMSPEDANASGQNLKVERTPLGKETVDSHPCVKNRVLIKDPKGALVVEATTWNASDLKDFPVQIATRENENTTIMRFRDIKLAKPDAKLFEPPAGFTAYKDPEAIRNAVAQKLPAAPAKK